jgi:predicted porin
MKQYCKVIAVLTACAGSAHAQTSTVALYGIIDGGIVRESGGVAGAITKVTSGVGSASRLGFRGSEDLGGGTAAIFTLESGVKIDTGDTDVSGVLFNRQAFAGVKTRFGTLTLGRQYTPLFLAVTQVADPFKTGYVGNAKSLLPTAGNNTRTSNTVYYAMPELNRINADLAYSMGEQAGDGAAGRQIGASVGYNGGKLKARLAYNNRNSDVSAAAATPAVSRDIGTNVLLATNYDFGLLKAFFSYSIDKGFNSAPLPLTTNPYGGVRTTASTDSRDLLLGLQVPMGGGTFMAMYLRKDDKTGFNQDARQVSVAYSYPLSKRTDLYAAYGKINNQHGAGYTVVNSTESGSGNRASTIGLRHTF